MLKQPKKFDNQLYINYELKIKYMLTYFDVESAINLSLDVLSHIINVKINFDIAALSFINKIKFIESINYNNYFKDMQNTEYKLQFSKLFLEKLYKNRASEFKKLLKTKFDINYDEINFIKEKNDECYGILNNKKFKIDNFQGQLFCNQYKNILENNQFVDILIDYIADIIEKKGDINNESISGRI